jgi:hypothetical protein
MEKQRLRHQYNLSEGQLSKAFKVLRPAARTEVPIICDTQLVVEFYSR